MAKEAWGVRRKCLNCDTAFYDFKKESPACPKCGTHFEQKENIEVLESKEDDIPQNNDEIIVDELEGMEEDEDGDAVYKELDVEGDLIQVDPNLVSDDDIDNVFIEGGVDLAEVEAGVHDKLMIDGQDSDI